MTTPRIEEMVARQIAVTSYLRDTYGLNDDDTLNAGDVAELCEMIVEHFATQAHQAWIDEAVEVVKKLKQPQITENMPPMTYAYNQALNDTIKALQDNK